MIFKILRILSICKFDFKSPKNYELLVLDNEGIEYLEYILRKRNYFTLVTRSANLRKIYITPKIIFFSFFYFRGNFFLAYLSALVKIIDPKIVITYIDTSEKFHKLAKLFYENIKFLAIQTAIRDLEIETSEYLKKKKINFYDYKKNYFVPNLFCYGQFEIDYFKKKKIEVTNFKKVGSLKVSNFRRKKKINSLNNKRYDICLIPDTAINYNNFYMQNGIEEGFALIVKFTIRFCKENGKKIIIPMKRYNKDSKLEEINFFKKYLNQSELNFLLKNSLTKDLKNKYTSYLKICESNVTLSSTTSMLREALSLKKKIMVCVSSPIKIFDFPFNKFISLKNPSYYEFKKKLKQMLSISEKEYFDLLGKKNNYLIEDSNNIDANDEVNLYIDRNLENVKSF